MGEKDGFGLRRAGEQASEGRLQDAMRCLGYGEREMELLDASWLCIAIARTRLHPLRCESGLLFEMTLVMLGEIQLVSLIW